jgi:glutathione S-transferase
MSKKIRFVYWNVAARAQAAMMMLDAKDIKYVWDYDTANKWPAIKDETIFGQLPIMYDIDDAQLAQSGTITRYCAKIAGLLPDMPLNRAKVEMIMDHTNDIFEEMGKCKYAGDEDAQVKAWENFKLNVLPNKLKPLSNMLTGLFYGGEIINAADICVFSIINLIVRAGIKDCLSEFKNLYYHYSRVYKEGTLDNYIKNDPKIYFQYIKKKEILSSIN